MEEPQRRRMRGRRARTPEDMRKARTSLYATEEEWQLISEAAAEYGVQPGIFMRVIALREAKKALAKAT